MAIAWGSSYLAAQEVVDGDSVIAFLVLRFALAAGALAVITAPKLRHITRAEISRGVLFGVLLSGILILETFGVTLTSASNAGLIISLTIVMTPVLAQGTGGTRLSRGFYGAAVVAMAGVGLLTQRGGWSAPGLGDLLILLAAAARAVHVTVIARLSDGEDLDSARVTLVQLWTGVSVFAVVSRFGGREVSDVAVHMDARSWLLTGYLALVCTAFAFVVQMWAVRRSSPARVSLLLGTEPLWAAIFGIAVAHEPLTALGVAGAILVLAGTNWGRAVDTRGLRVEQETETGPRVLRG